MNVARRISLCLASGAAVVSLTGCDAVRGTFDFLGGDKDAETEAATAPAATAAPSAPMASGVPGQPMPFDLSGAAPMGLPASTLNVQSSAANAALIGATTGAAPSGFNSLTAGVPNASASAATYGAQPNPYAPRVPGTTNPLGTQATAPSYGLQPAISPAATPLAAPPLYATAYDAGTQPTAPAPAAVVVRPPSSMPLTAGLPSSAVNAINAASTNQIGTINPDNLSKSTIVAIQTALKSRGLYSDDLDGIWGSKSKASMNAYLASRGQSAVTLDTLFSLGVSL